MKIKEMMKKNLILLDQNDSVAYALDIMNREKINGAPVVNQDNKLVGMVVKADIYRFLIAPGHYDNYPLHLVMSKDVVTGNQEESVEEIARRLRENNIVAIPIIDKHIVIGIVSLEDVVDYFLDK